MLKPNWEYCECGCKGYAINNTDLWYYLDLKTGDNILFIGHAFRGQRLGTFTTRDELNIVAVDYILKQIQKLSSSLIEIKNE